MRGPVAQLMTESQDFCQIPQFKAWDIALRHWLWMAPREDQLWKKEQKDRNGYMEGQSSSPSNENGIELRMKSLAQSPGKSAVLGVRNTCGLEKRRLPLAVHGSPMDKRSAFFLQKEREGKNQNKTKWYLSPHLLLILIHYPHSCQSDVCISDQVTGLLSTLNKPMILMYSGTTCPVPLSTLILCCSPLYFLSPENLAFFLFLEHQIFCCLRAFEYPLPRGSLSSLFQIEALNLYTEAKCLLISVIWGLVSILLQYYLFCTWKENLNGN